MAFAGSHAPAVEVVRNGDGNGAAAKIEAARRSWGSCSLRPRLAGKPGRRTDAPMVVQR
jgi:hypothetical protein